MNQHRVFKNAPITEAIIDIQVERQENCTIDILGKFGEAIDKKFDEQKKRTRFEGKIDFGPEKSPNFTQKSEVDGVAFKCNPENKIVQARLNGYGFSKLQPYEKWETFVSEAKELWGKYRDLVNPSKVTRIGLRYINRIEIPMPVYDFKEYFLTFPEIAEGLPSAISGLFMRLTLPKPCTDYNAIITQAINQATNQSLPIIFDIDVAKTGEFDASSDEIWTFLAEMREYKNEIFFKSLTEKAKGLFE